MGTKNTPPGSHQIARHDSIFQEHIHDTYTTKGKPSELSVCPQCNAVFHAGRWSGFNLRQNHISTIAPHASECLNKILPAL